MARRAHFTPRRGAARDIASGPKMAAYMGAVADAGAAEVERRASSIVTKSGTIEGDVEKGKQGWEAVVRVRSSFWHFPEIGHARFPPRPYLRPGVQAVLSRVGGRWRSR